MASYMVVYDLHKQGQNYTDLIAKLNSYGTHWHVQGSVWIIETAQSAVQVREFLKPALDANDKLVVARLEGEAAWYGYGSDIDDWLMGRLKKKAA